MRVPGSSAESGGGPGLGGKVEAARNGASAPIPGSSAVGANALVETLPGRGTALNNRSTCWRRSALPAHASFKKAARSSSDVFCKAAEKIDSRELDWPMIPVRADCSPRPQGSIPPARGSNFAAAYALLPAYGTVLPLRNGEKPAEICRREPDSCTPRSRHRELAPRRERSTLLTG